MKLIIQIPCYNEEATLPLTIADLPRCIEGIDQLEVLVIDDGSSDGTLEVAKMWGVDHIVALRPHRGLAAAFNAGLTACLQAGADIIVTTDADNPFWGEDIPQLIEPILSGQADMVIGVRAIDGFNHYSGTKKLLQRLGSWVVSQLTRLPFPDPTSGFRAYSREAALRLHIISGFTYVLESIIQAASKGLRIAHVPIRTHEPLRESRLIKNTPHYLFQSVFTLIRASALYAPLRFFLTLGGILFVGGVAVGVEYFATLSQPGRGSHWLMLAVGLLFLSLQLMVAGLVGDLIAGHRKLIEQMLYRHSVLEVNQPSTSRVKKVG